jgi:hydroxymethylbilane synthase
VDLCVHSLKDLPTALPADIGALALLPREDPRDALVVGGGVAARSLAELPVGARVGTCSLRRRAQLLALRPDLVVADLRGNVQTRLRKLDEGQYDAILLAAAGLLRLGLDGRITARLEPPAWLSAPGQGAIAIQARADDPIVGPLLDQLHDRPTGVAVAAERALLNALEGGCQVPIGAAVLDVDGALVLHGLVAALDGSRVVRGTQPVDPASADDAGRRLAAQLVRDGADAILEGVRAVSPRVPVALP